MDARFDQASERLLTALRSRAAEIGIGAESDEKLLTRLELELREDGDRRQAAVAAMRRRISNGASR